MQRNYKYLSGLIPAAVIITGNYLGGWWVAANAVFSLFILALLEKFVPENKQNKEDSTIFFPDVILFLHVLMQIVVLISAVISIRYFNYSFWQLVLLAFSIGINTGSSSIVIAHELVHRKNIFFQLAGKFLLFTAGNIYFYVDHLKVHHKWVGTMRDPATARRGENVYYFFLRSTIGQIASSMQVEKKRLENKSLLQKIFFNYVIVSSILLLLFCIFLWSFYGIKILFVFLFQSLVANFLLEYTNYIEHYGLTRNENERVTEIHSWQSDKVISRYFLIDLSRHADHHYYASKPYHTLKSYEKAPVLPGGYVQMIYYALIPPIWFRVMHKKISSL